MTKVIKKHQAIKKMLQCKKHLKNAKTKIIVNQFNKNITSKEYHNDNNYLRLTYFDNQLKHIFIGYNNYDTMIIVK